MKLAAAALSLVLIVPGLAQSQPLAPPRLLYPGESPPLTSTPGTHPSPSEPLGYKHPECLVIYGKTPAQIEATPCGVTENIAANSTVSACTHNSIIDFQGDNITIDCVKWSTGATGFGTRCDQADGCENLKILRSTITGNNRAQGVPSQLLLLFNARNYAMKSALVEKNDISQSDVFVYAHSSVDGNTKPLPGEGDKALVIRGNRFHHITQSRDAAGNYAHTDGLYFAGASRGILVENNLIDATGSVDNWGSMIQTTGDFSPGGNYVFRNNHIITDATDVALNFDGNSYCPTLITWQNNKVDLRSPTLFSYSKASFSCPSISQRVGSSCAGNTFENGSPQKCSGNGL